MTGTHVEGIEPDELLFDRPDICFGDVSYVDKVSGLPTVFVDERRIPGLERGTEHGRHPGIRGGARHVVPVDVVITQCGDRALSGQRPGQGKILLCQLARRVQASGPERSILADELPRDRLVGVRATTIEHTSAQVGLSAQRRNDEPMAFASVMPIAVDHHGRGENESLTTGPMHGREEHGRSEIIMAGERRRIVGIDSGTHHRCLMTDHVDALERLLHRTCVADVQSVDVEGDLSRRPVG
jgi:hypothetical protein